MKVKQTFIITTKDGMSAQELRGCLEDTLGKGKVIDVSEEL